MKWKPLKYRGLDLSDRFLISENGDILSLKNNIVLKQRVNNEGYLCVTISLGSRKHKKVIKTHIAVAQNFVHGEKKDLVVNHKDGDKTNNSSSNLEWCSRSENSIHAIKTGLYKKNKRVRCVNNGMEFDSMKEASAWCGLNKKGTTISECLKNKDRASAGRDPTTKEKLIWERIL